LIHPIAGTFRQGKFLTDLLRARASRFRQDRCRSPARRATVRDVSIESDRRAILRNAAGNPADRPAMIGLAVVRGLALVALAGLVLIALR
jgi:hypothetical protein